MPVLRQEDTEEPRSKLGGVPWIPAGEHWPRCTGCGGQLSLIVQLHVDSLPTGTSSGENGLLQLMICGVKDAEEECWMIHDAFSANVHAKFVDLSRGGGPGVAEPSTELWRAFEILEWEEIVDFPSIQECPEIYAELGLEPGIESLLTTHMTQYTCFPCPEDKLGGWPAWCQSPDRPECPTCDAQMRFIFQTDATRHVNWWGAGQGYLWQCAHHPQVAAFTIQLT